MQNMGFWIFFVVLFAATGVCDDLIALPFTREIILRNVGNVNLSADFNDLVTGYVNAVIEPNTISANSLIIPPDVVIITSFWFKGNPVDVMTNLHNLNEIFDGWSITPNAQLVSNLNKLSLEKFERQPTKVDFTDNCNYDSQNSEAESSSLGFNNITLLITMWEDPRKNLITQLCNIFSLADCSFITLDSVNSTATPYIAQVTVTTGDRNSLFLELMDHSRYASPLITEQILSIVASGVQVFSWRSLPSLTYEGDIASCASHYWYLIFLVVLFPVVLIMGRRFYRCGEESGKKSIRRMEWDIRGGIRYMDQMQTRFARRGQSSQYGVPGPLISGNQYNGEGRQYSVWQNIQGTGQMAQQEQTVHYDPNASWQYNEEIPNQQFYSVTGRGQ